MKNFRRQWNLDRITITKIRKCFRANGCRKWRNRFRIENRKICCLGGIFWTSDRLRRKISQSRRSLSWRNQSYLPFLIKQMETLPRNHQQAVTQSQNGTGKVLSISLKLKTIRVEARNSMSSCEIYLPVFSETMHTVLETFSKHGLRKCR